MKIDYLETKVQGLQTDRDFMRGDLARLRMEIHLNSQIVDAITQLQAAVNYSRNIPIVIEDSNNEMAGTAVESEEGLLVKRL